jgi:hypothetical protein
MENQVLQASTSRGVEAVFDTLVRERADALLVAPDGFLSSRHVQFAILAARHGIPTVRIDREAVEAGWFAIQDGCGLPVATGAVS